MLTFFLHVDAKRFVRQLLLARENTNPDYFCQLCFAFTGTNLTCLTIRIDYRSFFTKIHTIV